MVYHGLRRYSSGRWRNTKTSPERLEGPLNTTPEDKVVGGVIRPLMSDLDQVWVVVNNDLGRIYETRRSQVRDIQK
jgi:hypothetical protein